jgi:hypothetical protein
VELFGDLEIRVIDWERETVRVGEGKKKVKIRGYDYATGRERRV